MGGCAWLSINTQHASVSARIISKAGFTGGRETRKKEIGSWLIPSDGTTEGCLVRLPAEIPGRQLDGC
jgi:hypothetical protein